jgi:hypothetical protein
VTADDLIKLLLSIGDKSVDNAIPLSIFISSGIDIGTTQGSAVVDVSNQSFEQAATKALV